MSKKITRAAVGVMQRADNMVLLAERPAGKPWSGYWEFPGGKVEVNETPHQALVRELQEELDVSVSNAYPWITRTFDYPAKYDDNGTLTAEAKTVKLYFFIVTAWDGQPKGMENQQFCWQSPDELSVSPMLPANTPIFEALKLPRIVSFGDAGLVQGFSVDVTHIAASALMALKRKPAGITGATCYDAAALKAAATLQLDYVVLSASAIASHRANEIVFNQRGFNQAVEHWPLWGEMIKDYPIPVYFDTGTPYADDLKSNRLDDARILGAHGLAFNQ